MTVHTYWPKPDSYGYTFGGRDPVASLADGDVLHVVTPDCFGGAVTSVDTLPSQVCRFPFLNPVAGPFFVDGAEPGDTLALHMVRLIPAAPVGYSATFPHFGALTATHQTAMLHEPLEERVWAYDIDLNAQMITYQARRSDTRTQLAMDPMIGTVGVAPGAGEVRSTIVPDTHGGNLDTPEVRRGATIYFGVNVEGAMFSLGDGHARQGQGELCGVGVEVPMDVTLAVGLIKGVPTPTPRLETGRALMSIGCARPLEDAYRIAHHDLVTWVAELTGLDLLDAYQLVSQAAQAPVGNVCDPNYTMLAKVATEYLPRLSTYGGTHARLHAIGTAITV